jgi:Flp pilus assembly protein TadD
VRRRVQLRADLAFQQRDFLGAAALYSEAIELRPGDGKLFSNRSACAAQLKQFDKALSDATQVRPRRGW